MQSLKKIGKEMPKIESEKPIYKSIKGHSSVLICQNLPICNPRALLHNIDSHTKFEENRQRNAKDREWKPISNFNQGPLTLYLFAKIYPSAISRHS